MKKTLTTLAAFMFLAWIFLVPALAQEGRSEVEPNNDWDVADLIEDLTIRGEIGPDDTDDWYVLGGQEGTSASFTIDFDEDELEIDWEIWSDDEIVASSSEYGAPETLTVAVPGECWIHVWHWSGQGSYRIEIEPATDECQGEDEIEPNDDYDQADLIDDFEIIGWMCDGDEDWFVLDGQEGREPVFTLYFDEDELEIDWEIWSDDEIVASSAEYGAPEELTARVPGECWIHLWHWSGEGEYTIEIEP